MLADPLGRPLRLIVTARQKGDATQAPALLAGQAGQAVLADKAYDGNALRALIASMGAEAVIPSKIPSNRSRKLIIPHDPAAYRLRNRVERCFGRLKHVRRLATRLTTDAPSASQASPTSPPPWSGSPNVERG